MQTKIRITYLSASDNISISHIPIPLYYSYSENPDLSGADIIYINTDE